MRLGVFCAALLSAVSLSAAVAGSAQANVVANWDKSARSWNNVHMTKIKAAMEDAGNLVLADAPISDSTLKAAVLVIGEPIAEPSGVELTKLLEFIKSGGMVLLFGDTGIDLATYNNLLTNMGSSIQFTTNTIGTTSALADGLFTLAPTKISGSTLNVTSGNGTTGGNLVDSNYVRYERLGPGYVVVFGDRIDHNDVISPTNTTLLLNIVAIAAGPPLLVPTLSTAMLALVSALLAAIAARHATRARRASPASARR